MFYECAHYNPENPRCPDLSELAQEVRNNPVTGWSVYERGPWIDEIREGNLAFLLQQATDNSKKKPRGIIGVGTVVPNEKGQIVYWSTFRLTGESGLFVDIRFDCLIDPVAEDYRRLDWDFLLKEGYYEFYRVRQSGWQIQDSARAAQIRELFLKQARSIPIWRATPSKGKRLIYNLKTGTFR
jgi:hypothetical protein